MTIDARIVPPPRAAPSRPRPDHVPPRPTTPETPPSMEASTRQTSAPPGPGDARPEAGRSAAAGTIRLILHGTRMDRADVREAVERLRSEGHDVEVRVTWEAGDAGRFARSAVGSAR